MTTPNATVENPDSQEDAVKGNSGSWQCLMGFLLAGLAIGDLIGLSASPIAQAVVAALFAATGGSLILLLTKLKPEQGKAMGFLLAALAIGLLVGAHLGILTNEYRWLSPGSTAEAPRNAEPADIDSKEPSAKKDKKSSSLWKYLSNDTIEQIELQVGKADQAHQRGKTAASVTELTQKISPILEKNEVLAIEVYEALRRVLQAEESAR